MRRDKERRTITGRSRRRRWERKDKLMPSEYET
jgi:hypothetical protein